MHSCNLLVLWALAMGPGPLQRRCAFGIFFSTRFFGNCTFGNFAKKLEVLPQVLSEKTPKVHLAQIIFGALAKHDSAVTLMGCGNLLAISCTPKKYLFFGIEVQELPFHFVNFQWAHGVVVSHPLRMRKALGSNPSVSNCILLTPPQLCCLQLALSTAGRGN